MTPDELDRILSAEDRLAVSSGFTRSVMEAVRSQALEQPPRSFPWLRFAAGLLACAMMALSGVVLLPRLGSVFPATSAMLFVILPAVCFAIGGLLLSIGLAALPRLLARR